MKSAGQRGENKWKRITWDEAVDIIEENYKRIVAQYGNESIVNFIGTGREATQAGYAITNAVFRSSNSCYAQSGWSCYGPRGAAIH
jgi:anaerobic selenocysteine-containing dehydrogenase